MAIRVVSIEWYTPYSEPPDHLPRVLRWGRVREGADSVEIHKAMDKLAMAGDIPNGYVGMFLTGTTLSHSFASPEKMQKIRMSRLKRRMKEKVPMFADFEIAKALDQKPEYFSVEGCKKDRKEKEAFIQGYKKTIEAEYPANRQVLLEV